MSFFGFDTSLDKKAEEDDLAVYTWGEASYDGLRNALEDPGDAYNDETFGGTEPVGKDFDFSGPSLPDRPITAAPGTSVRDASPALLAVGLNHGPQSLPNQTWDLAFSRSLSDSKSQPDTRFG